jgi:hypothetical protein
MREFGHAAPCVPQTREGAPTLLLAPDPHRDAAAVLVALRGGVGPLRHVHGGGTRVFLALSEARSRSLHSCCNARATHLRPPALSTPARPRSAEEVCMPR